MRYLYSETPIFEKNGCEGSHKRGQERGWEGGEEGARVLLIECLDVQAASLNVTATYLNHYGLPLAKFGLPIHKEVG